MMPSELPLMQLRSWGDKQCCQRCWRAWEERLDADGGCGIRGAAESQRRLQRGNRCSCREAAAAGAWAMPAWSQSSVRRGMRQWEGMLASRCI